MFGRTKYSAWSSVGASASRRVVLAEDVPSEEGEQDGHRPRIDRPGDARERAGVGLERLHDPLEGGDVRVDPVVAILDLDGLGHVELDAGNRPHGGPRRRTTRAYASRSPDSSSRARRIGRRLGSVGGRPPVDRVVTGRPATAGRYDRDSQLRQDEDAQKRSARFVSVQNPTPSVS